MTLDEAVARIFASRPTFTVGDRVVVRLSGECRVAWGGAYADGHPDAFDGLYGTVIDGERQLAARAWSTTHPLSVRFDDLVYAPIIAASPDNWWGGSHFAPTELERVTTSTEEP
jgi:hypothetical protein